MSLRRDMSFALGYVCEKKKGREKVGFGRVLKKRYIFGGTSKNIVFIPKCPTWLDFFSSGRH